MESFLPNIFHHIGARFMKMNTVGNSALSNPKIISKIAWPHLHLRCISSPCYGIETQFFYPDLALLGQIYLWNISFVSICKTIPTQHAYNFWWDKPEIACESFLLIYSEGITLHHNIYSVAYPTGRKLSFELNFAMLKYMQSIICRLTSKSPQTVRNMPSHSGPPLSALGLLWYTF